MEPIFEEFLFERCESDQAKANRQKAQADAKANDPNRKDQVQKMTKKYDEKNPESRQLRDKVANAKRAKSDDAESVKELKKQGIDVNNLKCKKCGSGENVQVDHVQQHTNAKYNGSEHLQALCNKCHQEKTKTEREKRGQTVNQFESFDTNLNAALDLVTEASDEDIAREKMYRQRKGDKQNLPDAGKPWREGGAASAWAALNAHSRASGRVHGKKQLWKGFGETSFPILYYLPHPQYPDDVNVVIDHISPKTNPIFGVPNKLIDSVMQNLKKAANPNQTIVVKSPIDNVNKIIIDGTVVDEVDSNLTEIQIAGEDPSNPIQLTGFTTKVENAVYKIRDFRSDEIIEGYPLPSDGNIFKFVTSDGIINVDLNEILSQSSEQARKGRKWLRWGSPSFQQPPEALHYIDFSQAHGGLDATPPGSDEQKKLYIKSYGKAAYDKANHAANEIAHKHTKEYSLTLNKNLPPDEADELEDYEFYRVYWDTLFALLKDKSAVADTLSEAVHYRIWKAAEEQADVALDQEYERLMDTRKAIVKNYKQAVAAIEKVGLPVVIRAAQGTTAQWGQTSPEIGKIDRELKLAYRQRKLALADAKDLELAYKQDKIAQDERDSKILQIKTRVAQLDKAIAEFKARLHAAETAPREGGGEMATAFKEGQLIESPQDLQTFWQTNVKDQEMQFSIAKDLTDEEWEKLHTWQSENHKKLYKALYDEQLEEISRDATAPGEDLDSKIANIKTEKRQMGRPIIKDPNTGETRQDLQGKVSLYVNKLVGDICEKFPSENQEHQIYHLSDLKLINQEELSDADLALLQALIPTFANTPETKIDIRAAEGLRDKKKSKLAKKLYEKDNPEAKDPKSTEHWDNLNPYLNPRAKEGQRIKGTDLETMTYYLEKAEEEMKSGNAQENATTDGPVLVEADGEESDTEIEKPSASLPHFDEASYHVPYDAEIPRALMVSKPKTKSVPDYHIKAKSARMIGPNGEEQHLDMSKSIRDIVISRSSIIGKSESDAEYWDSVNEVLNDTYRVEIFNDKTREHETKEYALSDALKKYFGKVMAAEGEDQESADSHSHRTKYQSLYLNDQGLHANNFYEVIGAGPEMSWAALESTTVMRSPNRVGIFINKRNSPLDQLDITGNIIKAKATGWNHLLRPSTDYDENTGIRRRESDIKRTVKEKTYAPREFNFSTLSPTEIHDKIKNHKARYGTEKEREDYISGHFDLMWSDPERGPQLRQSAVSRLIHFRAMERAENMGISWTGTGSTYKSLSKAEMARAELYKYAENYVKKQKDEDPVKFGHELKAIGNTIYLERYVGAIQRLVGVQDDVCTTCMGSGYIKVYSGGRTPKVDGTTSVSLHKGIGSDYTVVPAKKEEFDNEGTRESQAIQKCYACRASGTNAETMNNKTAVYLGKAESRMDKDILNAAIDDAMKTSMAPSDKYFFNVYLEPLPDEAEGLIQKLGNNNKFTVVNKNNKEISPQPKTQAEKVKFAIDHGCKLQLVSQSFRNAAEQMGEDPCGYLTDRFNTVWAEYGNIIVEAPDTLPEITAKLTAAIFPASLRNTVKTKIPMSVVKPLVSRLAKVNVDYMFGQDTDEVPKGSLSLKKTPEGYVQFFKSNNEKDVADRGTALPFGFDPKDKHRAITVLELADMFLDGTPSEPIYIEVKDDPDSYVLGQIVNLINRQYASRKAQDNTFKTTLGIAARKLKKYSDNFLTKMPIADRKEVEEAISSLLDSTGKLEPKLEPSRTKKIIHVTKCTSASKGLYEVQDLYETAKRLALADGHSDLEVNEVKSAEYDAMHAEMGRHGGSLGNEITYKFYINLAKAVFAVATEESIEIDDLIEQYSNDQTMRRILLDTMNRPFSSTMGSTLDVEQSNSILVKGVDAATGGTITLKYDISQYRDQPGQGTQEIPSVFLVQGIEQLKSMNAVDKPASKKSSKNPTKPVQPSQVQATAEMDAKEFAAMFKKSDEQKHVLARLISAVNLKHTGEPGLRYRLRLIGVAPDTIEGILKRVGSVKPGDLADEALESIKVQNKPRPKASPEVEAEESQWADIDVISEGMSEDIDGPDQNPVHRLNVDDIAEMLDD